MAPKTKAAKNAPADPMDGFWRLVQDRGSIRPPSTYAPCLQWAAQAALRDQPVVDGLQHMALNTSVLAEALVDGWRMMGDFSKAEMNAFHASLPALMGSFRALRPPLGPLPKPKAQLLPAHLDRLWLHVDYLAFRTVALHGDEAFLDAPGLADLRRRLTGLNLLLQQATMSLQAGLFGAQAYDALGIVEDLAAELTEGHGLLNTLGKPDPLWPSPDYGKSLAPPLPLPPGSRGPALPKPLATELTTALVERGSPRPLGQVSPWIQFYALIRRELDPDWRWQPCIDGRECAFPIFEFADDVPWDRAVARRLARLCTAVHVWTEGQPLPPPPDLHGIPDLDMTQSETPSELWALHDALNGILIALLKTGLLDLETPRSRKSGGGMDELLAEAVGRMQMVLAEWPEATPDARKQELRTTFAALSALRLVLDPLIGKLPSAIQARFPPSPLTRNDLMALLQPRPRTPKKSRRSGR